MPNEDWGQALESAKALAEQGNVQAMRFVASMIFDGPDGKSHNMQDALPYFKMAADHGDVDAASRVASALYTGTDVERNPGDALKYFLQCADAGRAEEQYFAGICYRYGYGCAKDGYKAERYFRMAALQNYPNAQWELYDVMKSLYDDADSEANSEMQHWLYWAYINEVDEAKEYIRCELRNGMTASLLQGFVDRAKAEGVVPSKYATNVSGNTNLVKQNSPTEASEKRFCAYCGNQVPAHAAFCGKCGNKLDAGFFDSSKNEPPRSQTVIPAPVIAEPKSAPSTPIVSTSRIKCPRCGGQRLQAVTETTTTVTTSGGGYSGSKGCLGYLLFGPFGLLCGSCGNSQKTQTSDSHQTFWVCSDCGHKFRNAAELKQEAEKAEKAKGAMVAFAAVFAIMGLFLFFIFAALDIADKLWWVILLCVVDVILGIVQYFTQNQKAEELRNEYTKLERDTRV